MSEPYFDQLKEWGRLIERLQSQGKISEAIHESIRANALAAKLLGPYHPAFAGGTSSLAYLYFQAGAHEQSIELLQDLLAILSRNLPPEDSRITEIGFRIEYVKHHADQRRSDESDIRRSGIGAVAENNADMANYLRLIGDGIRDIYGQTNDIEDLNLSIKFAERTLEGVPEDSTDQPLDINNLAGRLIDRYERTADSGDLDRAVELLEKGSLLNAEENVRATMLNNLAVALRYRYER
ncbi:tetratricopeptide repeat protein [Paraburkholderia strydomiana]|uniref:tetratricopeptide repeat protein n=1 Tax=Paraburkholderia strydomiana TaxID=1245417 RepID=UPI0038BC4B10